jgi:hypothetical protein
VRRLLLSPQDKRHFQTLVWLWTADFDGFRRMLPKTAPEGCARGHSGKTPAQNLTFPRIDPAGQIAVPAVEVPENIQLMRCAVFSELL